MHKSCPSSNNFDGSTDLRSVEKSCFKPSRYKDVTQVKGNSTKKRKSDICLHSGDSKLHQVGDKLTTLNGPVRDQEQFSLANCSKGPAAFKDVHYKKLSQKEGKSDLCKLSFDNVMNNVSTYRTNEKNVKCLDKKNGCKPMSKKQAFLKSFENLSGGCLKLLELDNYSDEVKYINAMKTPLSPILPEIEMPNLHLDDLEVLPISKDINITISRGCEKSQPSPDVICEPSRKSHPHPFHNDNHTGSSTLGNLGSLRHLSLSGAKFDRAQGSCQPTISDFTQNHKELRITDNPTFDRRLNLIPHGTDKLIKGNRHASTEKGTKHNIQQLRVSGSMSKAPFPTFVSHENPLSKGDDEADPGKKLCFLVLFASARNVDCMSRIIIALDSFTSKNMTVFEIDLLLVEVLSGLLFEGLQSEEKVAVFFSFLLWSLSIRISEHCDHIIGGDSFQFLQSFSLEISRVASVAKIKCFLDQMLHLNILFRLIESFLIEREVLVISDVKQHPSSAFAFSHNRFHLDIANTCVFSKNVTVSQLLAGCLILASICVAADDIGFLLTFCYKMLRTCQDDITSLLRALHVFADICGKCFFNLGNNRFLVVTISSVVTLIEGRKNSVCDLQSNNLYLTPGLVADLSPCKQCPFATDAICMDKLVHFMLDVLEIYSLPRNDSPNTDNYFITSNGSVPIRATQDEALSGGQHKFDVQCNASCSISRYVKVTGNQSCSSSEAVFCEFTDIISLVELVDQYMGWDWTYREAIPRLLKMVRLCVCEVFSTALLVLLGNLGRRGCSSCGYQQTGIGELRSELIESLDALIARKASLPTQIAAAGAMLNLLPLKFQDIKNENLHITSESCEIPCIRIIQRWFSQLSGEHQMAVKDIFDTDGKWP